MSKELLRHALGLEKQLYCFGDYLQPLNPVINYFPFECQKLPDIQYVGEWDDLIKKFNTRGHYFILKKDKNGYLYYYDKITKKRFKDPYYKYKVFEDGMIFREKKYD